MDNALYEEYLEQLVVEVEAKVGTMPECLLNPLSNEPPPSNGHRMSVVDEGVFADTNPRQDLTQQQQGHSDKDIDTSEEASLQAGNKQSKTKNCKSGDRARSSLIERYDTLDRDLHRLKDSMKVIRCQDLRLIRQLLHINDSIEELKWLNENYELHDVKVKDSTARSMSRYDSREQLHERWLSERRLLATSRTSLNTSAPNLSRLNQNNNSNGLLWEDNKGQIGVAFGPDTSPIASGEPYHTRSLSTSYMDNPDPTNKMSPLLLPRAVSSSGLMRLDVTPATSTPKYDANMVEESVSRDCTTADGNVSRVRVSSYGSQVRWLYKETEEDELYL